MRLASALVPAIVMAGAVVLWASAAIAEMTPEPTAVMQGLDKITARISRFETPVAKPVAFGTLAIMVRDCKKSAPEDRPENAAFIEITDNRPGEQKRRLFSGWMFSSSPALSSLEHPVYDVNLLECKGAVALPPAQPSSPSGQPPAKSPGRSRGKTAR